MVRESPHPEALCGPDSASWTLRTEAGVILALAGARAALLQLAHPKIAAGIAEHSYVESDPFERVRRTGEAMGAISFGSREERHSVVARLDAIHARVRGTLPSGVGYDARDPALMFFVLATLIESNLLVEERYLGIFREAERRKYYTERLLVTDAFGIPSSVVPQDLTAFRAYMAEEAHALEVGETARRIGRLVFYPSFVRLPRPVLAAYRLVICELLPPNVRRAYGCQTRSGLGPIRRAVQASSRAMYTRLPRRIRTLSLRPRPA